MNRRIPLAFLNSGKEQLPNNWSPPDPIVSVVVNNYDGYPITNCHWKLWEGAQQSWDFGPFTVKSYGQYATTQISNGWAHTAAQFTGTQNGVPLTFNFYTTEANYVVNIPWSGDANGLIPAMTGYATPSGFGSADSEYSYWGPGLYQAWLVFNGQSNTVFNAWGPDYPTGTYPPYPRRSGWLQYTFPAPTVVQRYVIDALGDTGGTYSSGPSAWTFSGYDGASWTVLDTRSGQPGHGSYTFTNSTAYTAYRLSMSDSVDIVTGLQVFQLQMFST